MFLFSVILLHITLCTGKQIPFCNCQKKEIYCRNLIDFDAAKVQILSAKENCDVSKFQLVNSRLFALPNEAFDGTNFLEMKLVNTFLPFLTPPLEEKPFLGGKDVTEITLKEVQYPYNWDWSVMNICQRLKVLRILKSNMLYIGPTFQMMNIASLRVLVIENSRVKWIHDKAFSSFKKLSYFHLIDNHIQTFKRSFLPNPAENLNVINLKNNALDHIEEDFFENMPELTYVNLQKNNFATLSEFKENSFFIDISGNPLRCDCSIKWLQKSANITDVYRIHCILPGSDHKKVLFRHVDWHEIDC
ncbi:leucine-rich repeat and fibronectin type-III domain-containing protein 5-like [Stegodyphus dumicola]|uniref:leucine-rich repeat and fibronectin type-III domain-containing protein 5-like n=1 Tax=Stegodyphus dumicola TaxID=202533 RepID=UPI0015A86EB9|nr:leucine-rich repeat and fibronectin type-III domain-containing protein 5-like [Stegodyphus dumicola]